MIKVIDKFKPYFDNERGEWDETVSDLKQELRYKDPVVFWYASAGFDLKALVHFNEKDCVVKYGSAPIIDLYLYSDYNFENYRKMWNIYGNFERNQILFFDSRTRIILQQIIPLTYFTREESEKINQKYSDRDLHPCLYKELTEVHFFYLLITIDSNYFGREYFHMLYAPVDNWILLEEFFKKDRVSINYLCTVTDGCRFGFAYKCAADNYKDFLPIMKEPGYFITDHIRIEHNLPVIRDLKGWGHYGEAKLYKVK